MLKILVVALCAALAASIKVKMYSRVSGAAKFSVRCADGTQPVMGNLNYALADATVSMSENINGFRGASDCGYQDYGLWMCESCRTNCGMNPNFNTHQSICTEDDAAVLCTGSSCRGGLRAIGTARCNGAIELQVESSKLIVNTPANVWVWASVKASDDVINVRHISGYVLSSGKEFEIGGGALVLGQANEEKVGKCCGEEGLIIYGDPPESCDIASPPSGSDRPHGGTNTGFFITTMLVLMLVGPLLLRLPKFFVQDIGRQ